MEFRTHPYQRVCEQQKRDPRVAQLEVRAARKIDEGALAKASWRTTQKTIGPDFIPE